MAGYHIRFDTYYRTARIGSAVHSTAGKRLKEIDVRSMRNSKVVRVRQPARPTSKESARVLGIVTKTR